MVRQSPNLLLRLPGLVPCPQRLTWRWAALPEIHDQKLQGHCDRVATLPAGVRMPSVSIPALMRLMDQVSCPPGCARLSAHGLGPLAKIHETRASVAASCFRCARALWHEGPTRYSLPALTAAFLGPRACATWAVHQRSWGSTGQAIRQLRARLPSRRATLTGDPTLVDLADGPGRVSMMKFALTTSRDSSVGRASD